MMVAASHRCLPSAPPPKTQKNFRPIRAEVSFCKPPDEPRASTRFPCYGRDAPSALTGKESSVQAALLSPFAPAGKAALAPPAALCAFSAAVTRLNQRFPLFNFACCIIFSRECQEKRIISPLTRPNPPTDAPGQSGRTSLLHPARPAPSAPLPPWLPAPGRR